MEDCLAIDVRVLRSAGMLRAGEYVIDALRWTQRGKTVAEARIALDLERIENAKIVVTPELAKNNRAHHIQARCISCNFGGYRFQLICPINDTAHDILYLKDGKFASRQAHALTYRCQTSTKLSRVINQSAKLNSRLEGSDGIPRVRGKNRERVLRRWRKLQSDKLEILSERIESI